MKNKKTQILSFIGGLAFFSIVATVLIVKNERLRTEIESQAQSLLKTSRNTVEQIQFVAGKVGKISEEIKTVKSNSNNETVQEKMLTDGYDSLWNETEAQIKEFSDNKLNY